MSQSRTDTIWQNDTGVVLSNAGNIFLEVGGGARCSWTPAATSKYSASPLDFTSAGNSGTIITRQSTAVESRTRTVDNFIGWPEIRLSHFFKVPCNGADRMFFEWRGEHTISSTGFSISGAGIPAGITRVWWGSIDKCLAYGSFFSDTDLAYAAEPFAVCWNSANRQKLYSPVTTIGVDFNDATSPFEVVSGMPLTARAFGLMGNVNESSLRSLMPVYSHAPAANCPPHVQLSRGGLLWGYTQRTASVDESGYPQANDKLGWVYEVGYPKTFSSQVNGLSGSGSSVDTQELSVSGLQEMYVNFFAGAPVVGVTPFWLDFTTASMNVRGRIKVIWVYENSRSW